MSEKSYQEMTVPEERAEGLKNAPRRGTILAIVCTMIAIPVGYVTLHRNSVAASTQSPVAITKTVSDTDALPGLEAEVRANPGSDTWLNLSLGYIHAGIPARAVPVLKQILASDPQNANAWNNLCVAHTMMRELQTGIDDCTHALSINPSFQLAKNNLKWAQDEKQNELNELAKMEQTPPNARNTDFYLAEGLHSFHIGSYNQAIQAWQRILAIDARNAGAKNNIGLALMMESHFGAAEQSFRAAIAIEPDNQLFKNNLAWALDEENKAKR